MLTLDTARDWLDGWRFGVALVDCVYMRRSEVYKELAYIARGGWTGWKADWQAGYVAALASAGTMSVYTIKQARLVAALPTLNAYVRDVMLWLIQELEKTQKR